MLDFPGTPVPLEKSQQTKLRKLFFPPLVLLESLNEICPAGPPKKASDAPPNPNESPQEMFQTLVNKLAQICDFEPKGNTITALTVIWYNGRVCYVLASNRRGGGALKNARAVLNAVLGILKANLEASTRVSDEEMEKRLLREILSWNNVRVRSYLISLSRELQVCMKRCDTSDSEGMWPSSKHYSNPSAAAKNSPSTNREKCQRSTAGVRVHSTRRSTRPEE